MSISFHSNKANNLEVKILPDNIEGGLLNPLHGTIDFSKENAFRAKKIIIKSPKGKTINSFYYTPLLSAKDCKLIENNVPDKSKCVDFCKHINLYYCQKLAFYLSTHAEVPPLAKEIDFKSLKNRLIDWSTYFINAYDLQTVVKSISVFAYNAVIMTNQLSKAFNNAVIMEYHRLVNESKPEIIVMDDTTLAQQMLLLEHFGIIDFLKEKLISDTKTALLLSYLLNKNPENIRHGIMSARDRRSDDKKTKSNRKLRLSDPKNQNFLNMVLEQLARDK